MQRSLTSLIVGLVLGVAAVVLMALYLRSLSPVAEGSQTLGNIVVAAADMPLGTEVRPEYVKLVQWPLASIPKDAFVSTDDIFKGSAQPGDRVSLKIVKVGEPIMRAYVSGFGGRATMSREVSRGMRAVAVRIDDVSGVAGFILPGDRVDVMLTRQIEGVAAGGSNLATDVILQNITVLGIDQLADQDRDKPVVGRTVTVEVTTEQAQKLALAQQAGTLGLALRNSESVDQLTVTRVQVPDLYGAIKRSPKTVHHVASVGSSVRVRYGDEGVVEKSIP
jgi:pilus assembly protein CpaB